MNPTQCLVDHVSTLGTHQQTAFVEQAKQYDFSSRWLADAIHSCKRKIMEGTGQEFVESSTKRVKSVVKDVVENSHPNVVKAPDKSAKKQQMDVEEHPDYDRIMGLKVVQLREELRSRALDTTGRKNELRTRLLDYVVADESIAKTEEKKDVEEGQEFVARKEKAGHAAESTRNVERDVSASKKDDAPKDDADAEMMDAPISATTKIPERKDASQEPTAMEVDEEPAYVVAQETKVSTSFFKSTASSVGEFVAKIRSDSQDKGGSSRRVQAPSEKVLSVKKAPIVSSSPRRAAFAKNLVKSASKLFSPTSDKTKSETKTDVEEEKSMVNAAEKSIATKPAGAMPPEESSSSEKESSATSAVSSSGISALNVPSVSTGAKAKHKALADARKARLAEIRGKSKPVTMSGSGGAAAATSDKSSSRLLHKSSVSAVKESKEDKRKLLAAQMREKAAASGKMKYDKPSTTKPLRPQNKLVPKVSKAEVQTAKMPNSVAAASFSSSSQKPRVAQSPVPPQQSTKPSTNVVAVAAQSPKPSNKEKSSIPKSISVVKSPAQLKRGTPKPAKSAIRDVKAEHRDRILSPMDTYEISDRSDSESESDDDSQSRKPHKKIPEWAQKHNLLIALERQYDMQERNKMNPDLIFSEVETCNLEEIFDRKKARYKSRTSSGNWTKDRVTVHEKLVYSRSMGYAASEGTRSIGKSNRT